MSKIKETIIDYTIGDRDMIRDLHKAMLENGFIKMVNEDHDLLVELEKNCAIRSGVQDATEKKAWRYFKNTLLTINALVVVGSLVTKLAGLW